MLVKNIKPTGGKKKPTKKKPTTKKQQIKLGIDMDDDDDFEQQMLKQIEEENAKKQLDQKALKQKQKQIAEKQTLKPLDIEDLDEFQKEIKQKEEDLKQKQVEREKKHKERLKEDDLAAQKEDERMKKLQDQLLEREREEMNEERQPQLDQFQQQRQDPFKQESAVGVEKVENQPTYDRKWDKQPAQGIERDIADQQPDAEIEESLSEQKVANIVVAEQEQPNIVVESGDEHLMTQENHKYGEDQQVAERVQETLNVVEPQIMPQSLAMLPQPQPQPLPITSAEMQSTHLTIVQSQIPKPADPLQEQRAQEQIKLLQQQTLFIQQPLVEQCIQHEPQMTEVIEAIQPEPQAEVNAAIKPEPQAEVNAAIKPEPQAEVNAAIKPEPQAEVNAAIKPEPQAEVNAIVQLKPQIVEVNIIPQPAVNQYEFAQQYQQNTQTCDQPQEDHPLPTQLNQQSIQTHNYMYEPLLNQQLTHIVLSELAYQIADQNEVKIIDIVDLNQLLQCQTQQIQSTQPVDEQNQLIILNQQPIQQNLTHFQPEQQKTHTVLTIARSTHPQLPLIDLQPTPYETIEPNYVLENHQQPPTLQQPQQTQHLRQLTEQLPQIPQTQQKPSHKTEQLYQIAQQNIETTEQIKEVRVQQPEEPEQKLQLAQIKPVQKKPANVKPSKKSKASTKPPKATKSTLQGITSSMFDEQEEQIRVEKEQTPVISSELSQTNNKALSQQFQHQIIDSLVQAIIPSSQIPVLQQQNQFIQEQVQISQPPKLDAPQQTQSIQESDFNQVNLSDDQSTTMKQLAQAIPLQGQENEQNQIGTITLSTNTKAKPSTNSKKSTKKSAKPSAKKQTTTKKNTQKPSIFIQSQQNDLLDDIPEQNYPKTEIKPESSFHKTEIKPESSFHKTEIKPESLYQTLLQCAEINNTKLQQKGQKTEQIAQPEIRKEQLNNQQVKQRQDTKIQSVNDTDSHIQPSNTQVVVDEIIPVTQTLNLLSAPLQQQQVKPQPKTKSVQIDLSLELGNDSVLASTNLSANKKKTTKTTKKPASSSTKAKSAISSGKNAKSGSLIFAGSMIQETQVEETQQYQEPPLQQVIIQKQQISQKEEQDPILISIPEQNQYMNDPRQAHLEIIDSGQNNIVQMVPIVALPIPQDQQLSQPQATQMIQQGQQIQKPQQQKYEGQAKQTIKQVHSEIDFGVQVISKSSTKTTTKKTTKKTTTTGKKPAASTKQTKKIINALDLQSMMDEQPVVQRIHQQTIKQVEPLPQSNESPTIKQEITQKYNETIVQDNRQEQLDPVLPAVRSARFQMIQKVQQTTLQVQQPTQQKEQPIQKVDYSTKKVKQPLQPQPQTTNKPAIQPAKQNQTQKFQQNEQNHELPIRQTYSSKIEDEVIVEQAAPMIGLVEVNKKKKKKPVTSKTTSKTSTKTTGSKLFFHQQSSDIFQDVSEKMHEPKSTPTVNQVEQPQSQLVHSTYDELQVIKVEYNQTENKQIESAKQQPTQNVQIKTLINRQHVPVRLDATEQVSNVDNTKQQQKPQQLTQNSKETQNSRERQTPAFTSSSVDKKSCIQQEQTQVIKELKVQGLKTTIFKSTKKPLYTSKPANSSSSKPKTTKTSKPLVMNITLSANSIIQTEEPEEAKDQSSIKQGMAESIRQFKQGESIVSDSNMEVQKKVKQPDQKLSRVQDNPAIPTKSVEASVQQHAPPKALEPSNPQPIIKDSAIASEQDTRQLPLRESPAVQITPAVSSIIQSMLKTQLDLVKLNSDTNLQMIRSKVSMIREALNQKLRKKQQRAFELQSLQEEQFRLQLQQPSDNDNDEEEQDSGECQVFKENIMLKKMVSQKSALPENELI